MLFRKRRLIAAYAEGADLVCLALYQVFLSVLSDVVGAQHTPEQLKSVSANVVNRLVLRAEARADPRNGSDRLAQELREICDLQMDPLAETGIARVFRSLRRFGCPAG